MSRYSKATWVQDSDPYNSLKPITIPQLEDKLKELLECDFLIRKDMHHSYQYYMYYMDHLPFISCFYYNPDMDKFRTFEELYKLIDKNFYDKLDWFNVKQDPKETINADYVRLINGYITAKNARLTDKLLEEHCKTYLKKSVY